MSKLFINTCVLAASFVGFIGFATADPMRPPAWASSTNVDTTENAVQVEQFKLQQILRSDDRLLAIVNGKVLEKGQKVSGAKVLRISENSVELKIGSRKKVLLLTPGIKDIIDAK